MKQGEEPLGTVSWNDLQALSSSSRSIPTSGDAYIAAAIRMLESDIIRHVRHLVS